VTQIAEAFSGQPTLVNVRFQFYFPVDDERYLPVSEELAGAPFISAGVLAPHYHVNHPSVALTMRARQQLNFIL